MARKVRSYEADEIIIDYDVKRCIHAEECVHGLPKVFDATRRPWIDATMATPDEITRAVEKCPTGALHYRWRSDQDSEQAPPVNTVRVSADGPLYFKGQLRFTMPDGETIDETRAALCRCGASKDKPFCDNSHRDTGFAHDGSIAEIRLKPVEPNETMLEISLAKDGPVLFRGRVTVDNDKGETVETGGGAFCRCGQSSTKPFCDGTHKTVGFKAD